MLATHPVVVVDTDAWSHLYIPRSKRHSKTERWRDMLVGATAVIAAQTRAEVLAGVFAAGDWSEHRRQEVRQRLDQTATAPVDERTIEHYARLTAACRATGHALGQKIHAGDRWVAATAVALDAPLLSGDHIYRDAPSLRRVE